MLSCMYCGLQLHAARAPPAAAAGAYHQALNLHKATEEGGSNVITDIPIVVSTATAVRKAACSHNPAEQHHHPAGVVQQQAQWLTLSR